MFVPDILTTLLECLSMAHTYCYTKQHTHLTRWWYLSVNILQLHTKVPRYKPLRVRVGLVYATCYLGKQSVADISNKFIGTKPTKLMLQAIPENS